MQQMATDGRKNLAELRHKVEQQPDSMKAHLKLGTELARLGKADEAEKELRRAIELEPKNAGAWINLGGVLMSRFDFVGCIEANTRAAECDPSLLAAHFNCGMAHMYQNEPDLMRACFAKVVEIDPSHGSGHHHLAAALHALGHSEQAQRHIDIAASLGHSPDPQLIKAVDNALHNHTAGGKATVEINIKPKTQN